MAELRKVNINGDESNVVDAYSKAETNALIATRAPQSTTYTKDEVDDLIDAIVVDPATDTVYGTVKINPDAGITLNADGQLDIKGLWGESADNGVYYPTTITPEMVAKNSVLVSEATNLTVGRSRIFALFAGANITLKKTAAAGATTFEVSNTFANRFTCAAARGGYMTIDEASAGTIMVKVTSVHTANDPNTQLVPYSGATESGNNIIITTDAPLSTTDSITKVRVYGSMNFDSSLHIGQGVGTGGVTGKGKLLQLGQSQCSLDGNSIIIGNGMFNSKNRVFMSGASHINHVQGACLTGEGHDTTNGTFVGVAAHGRFSDVDEHTAFAIGNGTSNTARSNLFEILDDGRVKATGTPTDNDDLTTKAYVDSAIGGGGLEITTYSNADFTYEQVLDPDTQEVINECVAYSTSSGNSNEPTATKYGRIVNLAGAFKNINVRPDTTAFDMGKVPAGCEPLKTQYILNQGTSQNKFMLTIRPDGTLNCSRYSTGASAAAVPNNAWLNINATYVSAS